MFHHFRSRRAPGSAYFGMDCTLIPSGMQLIIVLQRSVIVVFYMNYFCKTLNTPYDRMNILLIIVRLKRIATVLFLCTAAYSGFARADSYIQPPDDIDVIGSLQYVKAHQNETLLDIARNNDVGQEEILIANRGCRPLVTGQ